MMSSSSTTSFFRRGVMMATCCLQIDVQSTKWWPCHWTSLRASLVTCSRMNNLQRVLTYLQSSSWWRASNTSRFPLTLHLPKRSLCSSNKVLLEVPKTRLRTYGDRAFEVSAPQLWNSLLLRIKQCTSTMSFKQKLKTIYLWRLHMTVSSINCMLYF